MMEPDFWVDAVKAQGMMKELQDLKQDLQKSDKGTITVYAPNGQAVQAPTQLPASPMGSPRWTSAAPSPDWSAPHASPQLHETPVPAYGRTSRWRRGETGEQDRRGARRREGQAGGSEAFARDDRAVA